MPKFLLSYRVPRDYRPSPQTGTAWTAWFDSPGGTRVDPGHGVIETGGVGELGPGTRIGGYSVVVADDLEAALAVAKSCPAPALGGGVEVGVIAERPSTTPAS